MSIGLRGLEIYQTYYIAIRPWVLAILSGVMTACVGSIPGQILSLPEYAHVVLPETYKKNIRSWSSNYCNYTNQGITTLVNMASILMLLMRLITPAWLCPTLRLRTLLLLSCGLVLVGSIITYATHLVTFIVGTSLMGIGGGVARLAIRPWVLWVLAILVWDQSQAKYYHCQNMRMLYYLKPIKRICVRVQATNVITRTSA